MVPVLCVSGSVIKLPLAFHRFGEPFLFSCSVSHQLLQSDASQRETCNGLLINECMMTMYLLLLFISKRLMSGIQ